MCGRYGLNVNANDLATVYRAIGEDIDGWTPQYSIAPSTTVPILLALPGDPDQDDPRAAPPRPAAPAAVPAAENAVRILEPARWGFRPAWANESGPRPINARLETVASNGMFRASFRAHRAIVPMTGYYEWTPGRGKTKIPHWIHGDAGLLHAAGVTATTTTDGVATTTVAIITTTGTDRAGEIHDRMPVFLTPEISTSGSPRAASTPPRPRAWCTWPVSRPGRSPPPWTATGWTRGSTASPGSIRRTRH
ncbi:MAG: SOS response-associated peptidase [Acidipropionibacterium sp.]|jgi:putative SOS response-associated peptidase YedK|nr:SOS response-associated peptidase [Acidipropionibacterium sp.]